MKQCVKCQEIKDNTLFGFSRKNKDNLHSWCKACVSKARMKRYYENHQEERTNGNKRNQEAWAINRQKIWNYLSEHPCVDCGNSDIRVLEFDHVRGEKVGLVSALAKSKHRWEPIYEEILKCDVRCANCHRIKTYDQLG